MQAADAVPTVDAEPTVDAVHGLTYTVRVAIRVWRNANKSVFRLRDSLAER